jgi:hypothetical protein
MLLVAKEALEKLAPFVKIIEYTVMLVMMMVAVYATRKVKASAKQVRNLIGASERLRLQSEETALFLTEAAEGAINKLRASISEDLSEAIDDAIGRMRTAVVSSSGEAIPQPAGGAIPTHEPVVSSKQSVEREAHRQWWQPVLDTKLPDGHPTPRLYWKNNVRVPLPMSDTWLTVWHNEADDGVCGVAISGKAKAVDALWQSLERSTADLKAALPAGSTVEAGRFGVALLKPNAEFANDDERRAWMQQTMKAFIAVLEPKIRALRG